jgi:hypothetical protein
MLGDLPFRALKAMKPAISRLELRKPMMPAVKSMPERYCA